MRRTRDFAEIIRQQAAADPELAEALARESFNADVAMQVYNARVAAGLTQTELARRAGTHQSVISRIEDADSDSGHSFDLLNRIARALGNHLRVEFTREPSRRVRKTARKRSPRKAATA